MNRDFCSRGWRSGLPGRIAVALPSFENYRAAHSKAGFSRLLDRLGLPQPRTQIVTSQSELRASIEFPAVVKTSVGTASRGIWFVRTEGDLLAGAVRARRRRCLCRRGAGAGSDRRHHREGAVGILPRPAGRLSRLSPGRGRRRRRRGDQAERQPSGRARLSGKDRRGNWRGMARCRSTTIMPYDGTAPLLIDCNPRLVEPVNAWRSGSDLVELLLRVSQGETPAAAARQPRGRADASCHAGAARTRLARRHAGRNHKGMLAAADRRRALCRQQRGNDAGAASTGSAPCRWR